MRCIRCGRRGAYPGARFCGGACSARFEGGDRISRRKLILNTLFIVLGFWGALLFMAAWAETLKMLLNP